MGRLAGKKIFITGGAQGLGAAMAKGVASEGAKVTVTDINKGGAGAIAAEFNAAHGARRCKRRDGRHLRAREQCRHFIT